MRLLHRQASQLLVRLCVDQLGFFSQNEAYSIFRASEILVTPFKASHLSAPTTKSEKSRARRLAEQVAPDAQGTSLSAALQMAHIRLRAEVSLAFSQQRSLLRRFTSSATARSGRLGLACLTRSMYLWRKVLSSDRTYAGTRKKEVLEKVYFARVVFRFEGVGCRCGMRVWCNHGAVRAIGRWSVLWPQAME